MPIPTLKPNEPDFSVDTAALGRIDALPLTVGRVSEIEKAESETSRSFMNTLLVTVGRKNDGMELTEDDVSRLSDAEMDRFAKMILDLNQYLFRERVEEKRKDDEGRVVHSVKDGGIRHKKEKGESDSGYLFRLFDMQTALWKERQRSIVAPFQDILKAHKRLFTPSFLDSFNRSRSASAQLGEMISRLRPNVTSEVSLGRIDPTGFDDAKVPVPDYLSNIHNPVYDTNARLSDVVDVLDSMEGLALQVAETVRSVSDTASQFIVDFGAATEKADRSSRRAIWIAVVAIGVAALSPLVQIGHSEWRTQRDRDTATAIIDISNRIESGLRSATVDTTESFDRLSEAIERLTESSTVREGAPVSTDSNERRLPPSNSTQAPGADTNDRVTVD